MLSTKQAKSKEKGKIEADSTVFQNKVNFRPVFLAALGIGVGAAFIKYALISRILAFIITFIAMFACVFFIYIRKVRTIALFSIAFLIGFALANIKYPKNYPNGIYLVKGTVSEASYDYIELSGVSLNGSNIGKKLYVKVNNDYEIDTIVQSELYLNFTANEANINTRLRYCSLNYIATANANSGEIEVTGQAKTLNGFFKDIRQILQNNIEGLFGRNSNIISLILLAKSKTAIDYDTLSSIRDSGIAHIFALSGLHIAIFAWVLMLVLKPLSPILRYSILTLFLVVYTAVAGFPPSLVRSLIMSLFLFSADIFNRRNDTLTSLSASLIVVLLIYPFQIFSVGLLLSYFAVLGLLLLSNPLTDLLSPYVSKQVLTPIASTVSATLGTFPVSSYFFKRFQVYSVITNVIAIPISSASLISAFVGTLIGFFSKTLATPFVFVANTAMDAVLILSDAIANMPLATVSVGTMPLLTAVLYYLALFAASDYFIAMPNRIDDAAISQARKYKLKISVMLITATAISLLVFM